MSDNVDSATPLALVPTRFYDALTHLFNGRWHAGYHWADDRRFAAIERVCRRYGHLRPAKVCHRCGDGL